jgi:hypothetical protein
MKFRSRNVPLLLLVLAVAAGLVWADNTVPARIPAPYSSANPRVTAATPRAEFEGPNSADYFNTINNFSAPGASILANPQIAAGPDELVMVVNSQIWRLPNGNAPGNIPTGLNPGAALIAGQPYGAQRAFLDNWIGEDALAVLCPTGNNGISGVPDPANTRSAVTCQIDNATVAYDQMQGRFLVLFTVVDTGLTFNNAGGNYVLTRPRKASWVLIVSRFAVLIDQACLQGTQTTACPSVPNTGPNAAGSFAFVKPTPAAQANTGGISNTWAIYYGDALGTNTTDGFGSNKAAAGTWAGTVGFGNINAIPGLANTIGTGQPQPTPTTDLFDCTPTAVPLLPQTVAPTTVCYLPTGARLGIDNDTVTIASPVINANINGADMGPVFDTTAGATFQLPAYAGTRIRVIKKTAIYNFKAPLASGDQFHATLAFRTSGDYYDLYTSPTNDGAPVATAAGAPPAVFTAVLTDTPCANGVAPAGTWAGGGAGSLPPTNCVFTPLFYEPAHLRGRAMATFSNVPGGPSQTYLLGAQAWGPGFTTNVLWLQGIREIYTGTPPLNSFGPFPFYPVLQAFTAGGFPPDQRGLPVGFQGSNQLFGSPQFNNGTFAGVNPLVQQTFRNGNPAPNLYVGDQRPHKVIFREGHLYDARVVGTASATFVPSALVPTVSYEITQKLSAFQFPVNVYNQVWQNTNAYAPMFDVPANVVTFGIATPFNALNYLEKVFVATTSPPLSGSPDTFYNTAPAGIPAALANDFVGGDPRSRETFGSQGLPSTQLPAMANCYNGFLSPGSGPANNPHAWASLYDTRCGQDATDSNPPLRNPFTGVITSTPSYTIRGDEAVDPNDGSLWNFGAYAQKRDASVSALAHWGTFAANYRLTFPDHDVYGNSTIILGGIATDAAGNPRPEFPYMQMALNLGFTPTVATGATNSGQCTVTAGSNQATACPAALITAVAPGQPITAEGIPAGAVITAASGTTITFSIAANALAPGAVGKTLVTAYAGNSAVPGAVGIPFVGVNPALYGTAPGAVPVPAGMTPPGNAPPAGTFGADDAVTRREMAYWIVKGQMDEAGIINYLTNTVSLNGVAGLAGVSFADVPRNDPGWPYVEIMARRGYTSGCGGSSIARRYCPDIVSNRRDLAAYMIRAKMSNVFPSVLSGCGFAFVGGTTSPTESVFPPAMTTTCAGGDNFGLFVTGLPYFSDNPAVTGNDWYAFIQKMRELRITNGTSLGPANDGRNGTYSPGTSVPVVAPDDPGALLRKQVAVFVIRGYFF